MDVNNHHLFEGLFQVSLVSSIVPSRGAPWESRRSGYHVVHLIVFGKMSHRVPMILAWEIHGVAKIYPIARLLASLDS
jgi:hypothetical protein